MKYFLTFLIMSMWSTLLLANPDFVGTWVFSDSQCRDSNLESNSRRSIVWDSGDSGLDPSSMKIVIESDKSASYTSVRNGNPSTEQGSWDTVADSDGNVDPTHFKVGNTDGGFQGWLDNGQWVVDAHYDGEILDDTACGGGDATFVVVFNKLVPAN